MDGLACAVALVRSRSLAARSFSLASLSFAAASTRPAASKLSETESDNACHA